MEKPSFPCVTNVKVAMEMDDKYASQAPNTAPSVTVVPQLHADISYHRSRMGTVHWGLGGLAFCSLKFTECVLGSVGFTFALQ